MTVFQIINLYFDAILKTKNFEDYKTITDTYVSEVKNSSLADKEKESLFAAFSVSIQSYFYWINLDIK